MRYLLVQDLLRRREFALEPVLGKENVADLLTKPVSQSVLDHVRDRLLPEDTRSLGAMCVTRQKKRVSSRVECVLACSLVWAQFARAGAASRSDMSRDDSLSNTGPDEGWGDLLWMVPAFALCACLGLLVCRGLFRVVVGFLGVLWRVVSCLGGLLCCGCQCACWCGRRSCVGGGGQRPAAELPLAPPWSYRQEGPRGKARALGYGS